MTDLAFKVPGKHFGMSALQQQQQQ